MARKCEAFLPLDNFKSYYKIETKLHSLTLLKGNMANGEVPARQVGEPASSRKPVPGRGEGNPPPCTPLPCDGCAPSRPRQGEGKPFPLHPPPIRNFAMRGRGRVSLVRHPPPLRHVQVKLPWRGEGTLNTHAHDEAASPHRFRSGGSWAQGLSYSLLTVEH